MVASFLVYFLVYLLIGNQVVLNSPFIYQTHSQVSDHF